MKILRGALVALGVAFVLLQFYRPERTEGPVDTETSIVRVLPVPAEIESMLRRSCYDCHSYGTKYPWYTNVQPVGWWMQGHIDEARGHLNFDMFGAQRTFRQYNQLGEIEGEVREERMPLPSYLPMHSEAVLTDEDRTMLVHWSQAMRDSMEAWYPPDSLRRPRPGVSNVAPLGR